MNDDVTTPVPPSFLKALSRSQVASAIASALDYVVLFFLTEFFGVWYVASTAIGAFIGAVANFVINRHWSFEASHVAWDRQAFRYALVSSGSLILNSGGVWLATEGLDIHYSISVFGVSLIVGFLFNFPLQRHFVFR